MNSYIPLLALLYSCITNRFTSTLLFMMGMYSYIPSPPRPSFRLVFLYLTQIISALIYFPLPYSISTFTVIFIIISEHKLFFLLSFELFWTFIKKKTYLFVTYDCYLYIDPQVFIARLIPCIMFSLFAESNKIYTFLHQCIFIRFLYFRDIDLYFPRHTLLRVTG